MTRTARLAAPVGASPGNSSPGGALLTAEKVYRYASRFADRAEQAGEGTQWPTFRRAAKRFKATYDDIESAINDYCGDGYLGIGIGVQIPGVGGREYDTRGEYVIEAYGENPTGAKL